MSRYRVEAISREHEVLETVRTAFRTWADRHFQAMTESHSLAQRGLEQVMIVDTFDGDRVVRHWINGTEEDVS